METAEFEPEEFPEAELGPAEEQGAENGGDREVEEAPSVLTDDRESQDSSGRVGKRMSSALSSLRDFLPFS
jgi:hypothetical protein